MAQARPRTTTRRVASPVSIPATTLPLSACIADYLAECVARGLRPLTVEHYRRSLRLFADCIPDGADWGTASGVRAAVAALRQRPYRTASVNMIVRVWKSFLRFCHTEGICAEDLGRHIKPPKAEPRRDPLIDGEAMQALIKAARAGQNPVRDEAILLVLYDCGLRAGELCALMVKNVDLGSRLLTVPSGKTGGRSVPFGRTTAKALRRLLASHGKGGDAPLFASAMTGEALSRFSVRQLIERIGTRAGVAVHVHLFRHSFSVAFLRGGANVFALQRVLGHSTLAMSRYYATLSDADIQAQHAVASPADRLGQRR